MRATNLIITIIICVTLLIIGFFFWPTPYRYDLVKSGFATYPLRIHRLTGNVEVFFYKAGKWIPLKRKEPKIKKIPEKELSKITGVVLLENGYLKGKLYNGTNWTVTKIVLAVKAKGDIFDEVLQEMKRKEREASLDKERLKQFGFSDKEIEDYLNKKEKIQVCVDKYLDDADFLSKDRLKQNGLSDKEVEGFIAYFNKIDAFKKKLKKAGFSDREIEAFGDKISNLKWQKQIGFSDEEIENFKVCVNKITKTKTEAIIKELKKAGFSDKEIEAYFALLPDIDFLSEEWLKQCGFSDREIKGILTIHEKIKDDTREALKEMGFSDAEVEVEIEKMYGKEKGGCVKWFRKFNVSISIAPLSTSSFSIPVIDKGTELFNWYIDKAFGYKGKE